jgi:pseudoazurin
MQKLILMTLILISPLAWSAEHKVKMLNQGEDGSMVFEPGYLQVEPGDTITFVPEAPAHNTNAVLTPEGGTDWKGEIDEEVTVTLNKEGVFIYQCDPHVRLGMVGVIQVGEATNLQTAKDKAASLKETMATNKGRLDQYMKQVK